MPLGGINSTDNEAALDVSQCADARNFLFEANAVVNRPGAFNIGATGIPPVTGGPTYASSIEVAGTFYNVILISNAVYTAQSSAFARLGSLAHNFDSPAYQSITTVNGTLMIPSLSGALHWVPGDADFTTIATAPYRYIVPFASRACGAYNPTTAPYIGQRTVAWSVAGDETTWTGSTNGSGSTVLADIPDDITGSSVLYNLWIIYRRFGIHIATLTGQAFPPFSFSSWNQNGVGCYYPSSLATADNMSFFIGVDDVYMFDTQQLTPIGYNIRNDLFNMIGNQSFIPRGFMTRLTSGLAPRLRYNLAPMSGDGTPNAIYFTYDVRDRTWAKHHWSYVLSPAAAFNYVSNQAIMGACLVDSGGVLRLWGGACDETSTLTTKTFTLGQPERDYKVHRVLLVYRDKFSTPVSVSVQLSSTLGGVTQVAASTKNLGGTNDWEWKRQWYDITLGGNFFTIIMTVPNNVQFQMLYLSLKYDAIGEFFQ
jgi:hypothetical protein